jgi:hypothetical protein
METIVFSLIIFVLAGVGLSVGVFFGRPPIKGSCGGLACGNCAVCPKRRNPEETP